MADVTRRAFLKLLGGGGAAAAAPVKPLLDVITGQVAGSPHQREAMRIVQELMRARGSDRYPIIIESLKRLGASNRLAEGYDDPSWDWRKKAVERFDEDFWGKSVPSDELSAEQELEQADLIEAQGSFNPDEPQPLIFDAQMLGDFLDANLPPDFKSGALTREERWQEKFGKREGESWSDEFHRRQNEEEARIEKTRAASPSYNKAMDEYQQQLFDEHPFYDYHREQEIAEARQRLEKEAGPPPSPATTDAFTSVLTSLPIGKAGKLYQAIRQGVKAFKGKPKQQQQQQQPEAPKQLTHQPQQPLKTDVQKQKVPVEVNVLDDDIPF